MRITYAVLLTLIFIACSGGEKITIEVKDLRDQVMPEVDASVHQAGDVEIFRSSYMGDSYAVIAYIASDQGIRGFQSYVKATQNFNEATYQWEDGETLNFILLSKENGQFERYTMTIESGTARMERVD